MKCKLTIVVALFTLSLSTVMASGRDTLNFERSGSLESERNSIVLTIDRGSVRLASDLFYGAVTQKYLLLTYQAKSGDDTVTITFTQNRITDPDCHAYHLLSTKGAQFPGTVVTDTLSLESAFFQNRQTSVKSGVRSTENVQVLTNYAVLTAPTCARPKEECSVQTVGFLGEKQLSHLVRAEQTDVRTGGESAYKYSAVKISDVTRKGLTLMVPEAGDYAISLLTVNGKLLSKKQYVLGSGEPSQLEYSLASSGVFLVQIEGNGLFVTEKVTLQ